MRLITAILCLTVTMASYSATPYSVTATRAERAYAGGEWANATALYMLMLDEHPDSALTYSRAIVSSTMMRDTIMPVELLERAMSHGVAIDSVLTDVRKSAFTIGKAEVYHDFLLRLQQAKPYIRRAIDTRLLDYYLFRNDGEKIIEYATLMLRGLPENIQYLGNLAYGYLLTGRGDEASATWERILEIDPDNFDTLVNIGCYYMATDKPGKAIPYLNRAQSIRPTPHIEKLINEAD